MIKLRETLCMPNKYYSEVTSSVSKSIKESLEKYNVSHIQESLENDKVLQILRESKVDNEVISKVVNRLHEHHGHHHPRIFRLPVARFDNLNGNNRIYPEKLWYNVMNNQEDAWKQNVGLCDHPSEEDDPGSLKNAAIVWLGMEIDKEHKLVYGIGSFVGPYGHLAQEIIDAGGKVGFSTSGFGELEGDNTTVNPDTYQIERLADCVLNPSQSVYGDISDEASSGNIEYTKQYATEENDPSLGFNQTSIHESINFNKENHIMENNKEQAVKKALAQVEEKELRKQINKYLRESMEISNPVKQMETLKDIQKIIHEGQLVDMEGEVLSHIEEAQKRIDEMVELGIKSKMKESEISVETSDGTQVTVKGCCGNGSCENASSSPSPIEIEDESMDTEPTISDISEDSDLSNLSLEQESTIRKYANKFFSEKHTRENPLKVLEEANNILRVARESKLLDLEALSSSYITKLQESISHDMDALVRMKKELKSDNVNAITESAKTLVNHTSILIDDVEKYKSLCEALAQKNSAMVSEYKNMKEKMEFLESKDDDDELEKNKRIVALTQRVDELTEAYENLDNAAGDEVLKMEEELKKSKERIHELEESIAKYSRGNAVLEKKNGLLESKLRATERKLENTKYELEEALDKIEGTSLLNEGKNSLFNKFKEDTQKKSSLSKDNSIFAEKTGKASLSEGMVNDTTGNYLREEVKRINEYYNDLEERFGEAVKPYKDYITRADKFREAQRRWLAVMDKVDTTFREAVNAPKVPSTDIKLKSNRNMDLNRIQENTMMNKFGLK